VRATFALFPVFPRGNLDPLAVVAIPAFLPLLAVLLLPWLTRRVPALAALVATTFVALPAVVCTLWHAEPRYFLLLVPVAAVVLAGTLGRSRPGRVAMAALVLVSALGLGTQARGLVRRSGSPCFLLLGQLRAGIPGRVLTFDPWSVAWLADREAVMIPSGGLDAIARVARRYDTRLLLVGPVLGRPQTGALVHKLEGTVGPLRVTTIARGGYCRLATLEILGDQRP
jgi:hypothetical protein